MYVLYQIKYKWSFILLKIKYDNYTGFMTIYTYCVFIKSKFLDICATITK